jgi:hypothetical protein
VGVRCVFSGCGLQGGCRGGIPKESRPFWGEGSDIHELVQSGEGSGKSRDIVVYRTKGVKVSGVLPIVV